MVEFKEEIRKIKNKKSRENILNKIKEIAKTLEYDENHYKNLKKPLNEYKRVHINKSYVIIFKVNKKEKTVIFYDYAHHDKIYVKKNYKNKIKKEVK